MDFHSKERNSEKVSQKQNGVHLKNLKIKILMDSGNRALIIHGTYLNKNKFMTTKIPTNQWSTMARSFSMSCEAEMKWKAPDFNVTAHVSAPFHVTTKKM